MKEGSGKETSVFIVFDTEEETSVHVLCEFEALASTQTYISGFLLFEP